VENREGSRMGEVENVGVEYSGSGGNYSDEKRKKTSYVKPKLFFVFLQLVISTYGTSAETFTAFD